MNIAAVHRIITDECRKRPLDDVVAETLDSLDRAIRQALEGWPAGAGTRIHAVVEIERAGELGCNIWKQKENLGI